MLMIYKFLRADREHLLSIRDSRQPLWCHRSAMKHNKSETESEDKLISIAFGFSREPCCHCLGCGRVFVYRQSS